MKGTIMTDQYTGHDEYDDDFFSGGEFFPSAKFNNQTGPSSLTEVGGTVVGTVISTKKQEQTVYKSNPPVVIRKPNGDAKLQLRVVLQTDYRNWDKCASIPKDADKNPRPGSEDDGVRAIYIKGWMDGAVRDAIRAAGAPGLRPGGKLAVKITELVETDNGNPYPKYAAQYKPPVDADNYFEQVPDAAAPAPQAQQPAPQAPPAPPAPAPQPAPPGNGWGNAPSYDEPPF